MPLGITRTPLPQSLGKGLQVLNFPIVYVYNLLLGRIQTLTKGGELSCGNLRREEFPRIPIQNYFYSSYFIVVISILHVEMLRRIVRGNFRRVGIV